MAYRRYLITGRHRAKNETQCAPYWTILTLAIWLLFQGHGQPQQQWSMPPPGQGYGGPPPGYGGHYGYQNPYSQPQQSFHPGPDYNGLPPDANQAQQGNKAHVPAPMTEANIILPARSTDRPPATAGPSTTAEDKIEEVAASTPLTGDAFCGAADAQASLADPTPRSSVQHELLCGVVFASQREVILLSSVHVNAELVGSHSLPLAPRYSGKV